VHFSQSVLLFFFQSFKLNRGENKETLQDFMLNLSQLNKKVKRFAWLSFHKHRTNKKRSKPKKNKKKRRLQLK